MQIENTTAMIPPPIEPDPDRDHSTKITINLSMDEMATTQEIPPQSMTPRSLYFAYGSNLSFTQMRLRCTGNPDRSSKPIAIARLDHWRWLICQAGYANVVPPAALRVSKEFEDFGDEVPVSGDEDAVFGVLFDMDVADEKLLDVHEGVDHHAGPSQHPDRVPVSVRPTEQGQGDYNKWYVPATVTTWLDEEHQRRWGGDVVNILVYVDENRARVSAPKVEYISRMNRAIREAETIGFPKKWAEDVMRKSIPLV
ncbi:hypothetical protein BDV25DRAFT_12468 [Aspergillus avenaceus]|uniref:gamma-glutamylcyclotransferase n=1 Tax=Aspergillus avenaceus TaxID=36643 RepID=A0A5N6TCS7_ASPAV|nr:hypothetical protein BDV25DRAFT_12468 [Aspergillus avenaceus]